MAKTVDHGVPHDDHVRAWKIATNPRWLPAFKAQAALDNHRYEHDRLIYAREELKRPIPRDGGTPDGRGSSRGGLVRY